MRRGAIIFGLSLGLASGVTGLAPAPARAKPSQNASTVAKATKKAAKAPKQKAPCLAPEVQVVRARGPLLEGRALALTLCDGSPNPAALDELSVLARPRDVERPEMAEIRAYQKLPTEASGSKRKRRNAAYVTPQVMRVHPGLLVRLQKVAKRFPGKNIEIVSGHRPDARSTSRHHHGFALDMRVNGVSREVLRDFLRTLPETGVGYYPNSFFVHMDVRDDKGYWVDRSGPGEKADYGPWPPKGGSRGEAHGAVARKSQSLLDKVMTELSALQAAAVFPARHTTADEGQPGQPLPSRADPTVKRRDPIEAEDEREEDELTAEQIAKIRQQARAAIQGL